MDFRKAIKLIFLPQDVCSYLYVRIRYGISGLSGTLLLKFKAFIFGVKIRGPVKCFGPIHIARAVNSEIILGKNVHIVSSSFRCTASSLFAPARFKTLSKTAKIIIDDNVGLNGTSITARSKTIHIGKGTIIGPNVTIMDFDGHSIWPPENRLTHNSMETDADVEIGKNVWIGAQSIILKGVAIGENSVIAAGSIVTKDIPINVLAGGVPAKVIRELAQDN